MRVVRGECVLTRPSLQTHSPLRTHTYSFVYITGCPDSAFIQELYSEQMELSDKNTSLEKYPLISMDIFTNRFLGDSPNRARSVVELLRIALSVNKSRIIVYTT